MGKEQLRDGIEGVSETFRQSAAALGSIREAMLLSSEAEHLEGFCVLIGGLIESLKKGETAADKMWEEVCHGRG